MVLKRTYVARSLQNGSSTSFLNDDEQNWIEPMTSAPTLTDAAAARVAAIAQKQAKPAILRLSVEGGGCSGFQYGFAFDEEMAEDDTFVQRDGVTLLVDPMSFQYLVGAEVDYVEGLEGSRFVVNNPNATTTCGCGASFSI